jgi:endonuclease/exonuclease/phosphatase (EEP) superfamily protein YafD
MTLRRVAMALGWTLTGVSALTGASEILALGQPYPLGVLQALAPYWCVLSLVLAVWATWTHRATFGMVNALAGVVLVVLLTPVVFAPRPARPDPGAPRLRVLTANVDFQNPRRAGVAADLLASRADIIGITEFSRKLGRALTAAGADAVYPYRFTTPLGSSEGLAFYSRLPIRTAQIDTAGGRPLLDVTVSVAGEAVRLLVVHTLPPVSPSWNRTWRAELPGIARWAAQGSDPTLVLGDFNASRWHPDFRRLLDHAHLRDVAESTGHGLLTSWPANWWVPPLERIDHILVRGGVVPISTAWRRTTGSDHLAMVADVALTLAS